eukprot:SAG11_NODE_30122_length_304_cov_0.639024_1_plen_31_part_01
MKGDCQTEVDAMSICRGGQRLEIWQHGEGCE